MIKMEKNENTSTTLIDEMTTWETDDGIALYIFFDKFKGGRLGTYHKYLSVDEFLNKTIRDYCNSTSNLSNLDNNGKIKLIIENGWLIGNVYSKVDKLDGTIDLKLEEDIKNNIKDYTYIGLYAISKEDVSGLLDYFSIYEEDYKENNSFLIGKVREELEQYGEYLNNLELLY